MEKKPATAFFFLLFPFFNFIRRKNPWLKKSVLGVRVRVHHLSGAKNCNFELVPLKSGVLTYARLKLWY